ncbi:MAG: ATP-binding protein [Bacteroidia bacterium]
MKTTLLSLFYFTGLLCWSIPSSAQKEYSISHYTSKNGLPQNSIKAMIMDTNGFLWMTTESGLVRFDGRNFKVFNTFNTSGLTANRLFGLHKTIDGKLLMTDTYGGLYSIKENKIAVIKKGNYNDNNFLFIKGQLPSIHFYLEFITPDISVNLDRKWSYPPAYVFPLSTTDYLIRTKNGIAKYHDKKIISEFNLTQYAPQSFIKISGNIYFFSKSNQLYLIDYTNLKAIPCTINGDLLKDNLFKRYIISEVFWDDDDSIACLRSGLSLYNLKSTGDPQIIATELITRELPNDGSIRDLIFSAKYHLLFVGTDTKGLYVYKEKNFRTLIYSKPEEGTNNAYYCQLELDSNHVYSEWNRQFGTDGVFKSKLPIKKNNFENILKDRSGNVWYSHLDSLLKYNSKENSIKLIYIETGDRACSYLEEGDSIWACMRKGIAYIKNDSIHYVYKIDLENANANSFGMLRSGDNKIWFYNCTGIFMYDTKSNTIDTLKSFYLQCVRNITPYKDYFLIGTYGGGYFLFKNNKAVRMPQDKNNYLSQVHAFVNDSNGYLWMTTNQGLFKARFNDLEKYFNDTTVSAYYMYYGEEDGINNTEFNGGCTSSALTLKNGNVSLPTMEGLVWFNPSMFKDVNPDSPIIMDAVYFDDKLSDFALLKNISPAVQSVKIDFATSYWGNNNNLLLEYKLAGYNKKWMKLSPLQKQIEFANLHSGKYMLTIRKKAGFGEINLIEKQIEIYITPKYYEKTWFILLCLFGATLFVIAIARLYAFRIKQQNKTLEEKVQQRTFELGTANEQLQQSVDVKDKLISIISHDVVTPLRFIAMVARQGSDVTTNIDKEDMRQVLDEIKNSSEKLHYNAQNILNWIKHQNKRINVSNTHVAVTALADDVIELLKEFSDSKGTTIINNISLDDIILTDLNILSIILHNLLTNAIKFTYNGTITIEANHSEKTYFLTVTDTGSGMKEEQLKRIQKTIKEKTIISSNPSGDGNGNGLGFVIISELIQLLNGKVMLESKEGKGTCVTLMLQI